MLKLPWKKDKEIQTPLETQTGNWMRGQVEEREVRRTAPPELQGKVSRKEVVLDWTREEKYPSPYHKFMAELKRVRIWINTHGMVAVEPGSMKWIWGFDSRSIEASLGSGCGYYLKEFQENRRPWLALVGGPCAFAFRGMWAQGVLCWISVFVAGLLEIRLRIKAIGLVLLLWHLGCYWWFNDAFRIKFFKVYQRMARPYQPISEEQHAEIVKYVGEDVRLAGLYVCIELAVTVGMAMLVRVFG